MHKCLTCNKLKETPDIECDTPTKCKVLECATTCYASPEGRGLLVGTSQTEVLNQKGEKEIKSEQVFLHCMCLSRPEFTTVQCAVTCLSCLKTLEKE
jgi:hypothetical protein